MLGFVAGAIPVIRETPPPSPSASIVTRTARAGFCVLEQGETMSNIIGASVYEGTNKDKSRLTVLHCSLPGECPVLKHNKCIQTNDFLSHGCIYGRKTRMTGYTKKAYRRGGPKLREFKAKRDEYGSMPGGADNSLVILGEYIWLPYAHMSMCKAVQFKSHSAPMCIGVPFVKSECFTPEAIVTLVSFRPRAMMGGEITDYQNKEVPRFLYHLKRALPDLYAAAVALKPEINARVFSLDDMRSIEVQAHKVSPGTVVSVKGNWRGVWDGDVITVAEGPPERIIGLYSSDADVSLIIRPKDLVVEVTDRAEIERLWEAGLVRI